MAQKSQLEELNEKCCHKCNIYSKYHCELNYIEQILGVAKLHYCMAPQVKMACEMEATVRDSLDSVPIHQIRRYMYIFFLCLPAKLTLLQIHKSSCMFCCHLQGWIVRFTSSMGKQEVPQELHPAITEHP